MQHRIALGATVAAAALFTLPAAAEFGDEGTFSVHAGRMFGVYLNRGSIEVPGFPDRDFETTEVGLLWQGNNSVPNSQPRVGLDYAIIDHLTIGGTLGVASTSFGDDDFDDDDDTDTAVLFGPRVGYAFMFNDWAGFWPRGGFQFYFFDGTFGNDATYVNLNLEAQFLLAPSDNWGFTLGPAFDIGLAGSSEVCGGGVCADQDFTLHSIGIVTAGLIGWF